MPTWFPIGKGSLDGWRLDVTALRSTVYPLSPSTPGASPSPPSASSRASSPRRPADLGSYSAVVTGVRSGLFLEAVGSFANVLHPLDQMPAHPHSTFIPEEHRRDAAMVALAYAFHIMTVLSFLLSIWPMAACIAWRDGTAVLATSLLSVVSSAGDWTPDRTETVSGTRNGRAPDGDVIVRTREGEIWLVKCTEVVARNLYSGVTECSYCVTGSLYSVLITAVAPTIMPSVILLVNCTFNLQDLISAACVVLKAACWIFELLLLRYSRDMSRYAVFDITPVDAHHAHGSFSN